MHDYVSYHNIVDHLNIKEGDIVLIGSDITLLAFQSLKNKEKLDLNLFIDSFIEKIGPTGTLLFPTYNWGFCSGDVFDYKKTPSKTGTLTNTALKRSDFIRTKHPIYSFAVWGKDSKELFEMNNESSFGSDSPFSYLHKNKAKMIIIGLDYQRTFTFAHYVEEYEKVSYRYLKNFTSDYIDHNGIKSKKTYSMYVRDLEKGVVTNLNPIGKELEGNGASHLKIINEINFYTIDLFQAFDVIQEDIKSNNGKKLFIIK
ncbi:AAC(3) family N-acetyltransferase [Metabacillus fastidiosus]|uniref:AAC(3) family N-acetyltransferase n=1 Tax=Metabacillus fastidiosus TaxID=1458 RepID=UPI003D2DD0BF